MENKELEILQDISKDIKENKAAQKADIEKLSVEAKAAQDKFEAEVKQLNEKLTAKDATIEQIQGEVKELKAKGGRIKTGEQQVKTIGQLISETIEEHKDAFMAHGEGKHFLPIKMETKASDITSSSLSGANYINYLNWQAGMEPTGQTRFRDIFQTIQSDGDFINYPRANSPVGAGSFGRQASEAATKAQVDRGYTMISLTLKAMAGFAIVSRQSLRNISFLQSWLPVSLMESLMDSEDTDYANTLVAAANGNSTSSASVSVEKLIDYIKNLRKAKYDQAVVMIDPDVWATILKTKPNDYSIPAVVTIDANGNVKILGRPVYGVNWLTGGRTIVGDVRKASLVQSEGLTLRQSDSHASIFTSNETAFLLERTEGLAIFRTDAFITGVLS